MPCPFEFPASQITWSEYLIEIHIFNDTSRSVVFFRSEANWSGATLFAKTGHVVFSKRRVNTTLGWLGRQRCCVSCVTGASSWDWLTAGQGLLSLQQVRVEGECFYFFCFSTFIHFPLSSLSLSFISSIISSISHLHFCGRQHKMTHKGWPVTKPQHNQFNTTSSRDIAIRQISCLIWLIYGRLIEDLYKQIFQALKGHDDHVITCLEFYGTRIVSGSDDNTLKVWSAITGKVSGIAVLILTSACS